MADNPVQDPTDKVQVDENYVIPISSLKEGQTNFIIKGTVSYIKNYPDENDNNSSRLFSFDVRDQSDVIRITAFKSDCNRIFKMIQKGKSYFISGGQVQKVGEEFKDMHQNFK